jgi:hypothetical protein
MGNQDAQIVAYLLGELPDAEREALERRFLGDDQFRDVMRSVEDDLIDDYVQGELPPARRERFETGFLSVAHRRQKVEFAQALNRALAERRPASVAMPAVERQWSRWALVLPVVPRPVFAAAAAVAIAAVVWFVASRPPGPARIAEAPPQERPDERPSPAPPAGSQGPRESKDAATPRAPSIATFTLAPGLLREAARSTTLVLPPAAELVRLELPIEPGDESETYSAELRGAGDSPVWRSGTVRPTGRAGSQLVRLDLEARLLAPGKYELTLTGMRYRAAEVVGYYYFSVERRQP